MVHEQRGALSTKLEVSSYMFFLTSELRRKSFCWSSHETKNGSFIYMSTWDLSTLVVYMLPLSWSLPAFTFHYILKRDFTENGRRTDNGLPFLFPKTKRRIGMVVFALTNKTCTPLLNVVFLLCCHIKSAQLVIMLWTPQSWPLHDTGWCTTSETRDYSTCLVHRAQASSCQTSRWQETCTLWPARYISSTWLVQYRVVAIGISEF